MLANLKIVSLYSAVYKGVVLYLNSFRGNFDKIEISDEF